MSVYKNKNWFWYLESLFFFLKYKNWSRIIDLYGVSSINSENMAARKKILYKEAEKIAFIWDFQLQIISD